MPLTLKKSTVLLTIFVCLIVIIVLLGFLYQKSKSETSIDNISESSYKIVNTLTGASITVKEDSVNKSGLIVTLKNDTDEKLQYGSFFAVEKYIENKWYKIPFKSKNNVLTLEAYRLEPKTSEELEINWKGLYGNLSAGHYRIIKDFTIRPISDQRQEKSNDKEYYLATEFEIK